MANGIGTLEVSQNARVQQVTAASGPLAIEGLGTTQQPMLGLSTLGNAAPITVSGYAGVNYLDATGTLDLGGRVDRSGHVHRERQPGRGAGPVRGRGSGPGVGHGIQDDRG